MKNKKNENQSNWYNMDLHIHTPASSDYQQQNITFLDILQRAEQKGLDIMAMADHNTIAGYRKLIEEINQLKILRDLNRLLPNEKIRLDEYLRLFDKILVLPAFEFTATFGFHILAIFSPQKSIREIEHLLLMLNISPEVLDEGAQTVGATSDVLTAYKLINDAGGLVIAAHANSSNGVAMRGFNFGGQTKIAYTQDSNLHALEVTDLEQKGTRTTATFFNGAKPEYPRRMHCIQSSDCHRLFTDPNRNKNLGIGDRTTDILLSEKNFTQIMEVFQGNDFSKLRPHRSKAEPSYNFLIMALDEGSNIIQDFHESMTVRGGKLYAILSDICAFANTNGGTLYLGLNSDPKIPPIGISSPEKNIATLEREITKRISPPIQCECDIHDLKGKKIIRVLVPRGNDAPYALDDNKIYIRQETETNLAVRDEIVGLVLRGKNLTLTSYLQQQSMDEPSYENVESDSQLQIENLEPKTGIELMLPEERKGVKYFTVRDLRNGNLVKNVTQSSARKLWQYAINRYLSSTEGEKAQNINWQGNFGLLRKYKGRNSNIYDFVLRGDDRIRYFYGVTADGLHGNWKILAGVDED